MPRWKSNMNVSAGQYPLVAILDLFFILLIFFLIGNSVVFWPGTQVETSLSLPRTAQAEMREADKLIITITRSGQIFFNEKALDWHGLEKELRERVRESNITSARRRNLDPATAPKASRPPMVALRADKDLPYERINAVMALARSLGLGVYLVADVEATNAAPQLNLAPARSSQMP
ncbi:MAG TPA: biopolymer transporter ExbD [Lentisphaeria bacterium]|nr:biopolymer transporter ExbD [Lentisphaeria bacterium]